MRDLISREKVLQALDGLEMLFPGGYDDSCYLSRADVINAINSVPAEKTEETGEVEQVEITQDGMKIKLKLDLREETNKALGEIAEELHKLNRYVREGYFRK